MKKLIAPLLATLLVVGPMAANAGGPVVVEEEGKPEMVAETPRSGWIVPVVVGLILICAIACGNDDTGTGTGGGSGSGSGSSSS